MEESTIVEFARSVSVGQSHFLWVPSLLSDDTCLFLCVALWGWMAGKRRVGKGEESNALLLHFQLRFPFTIWATVYVVPVYGQSSAGD